MTEQRRRLFDRGDSPRYPLSVSSLDPTYYLRQSGGVGQESRVSLQTNTPMRRMIDDVLAGQGDRWVSIKDLSRHDVDDHGDIYRILQVLHRGGFSIMPWSRWAFQFPNRHNVRAARAATDEWRKLIVSEVSANS